MQGVAILSGERLRSPASVAHFGAHSTHLCRDARDGFHHCRNGGKKEGRDGEEQKKKRMEKVKKNF